MTGPVIRYDPLGRAGRTPLPDSGVRGSRLAVRNALSRGRDASAMRPPSTQCGRKLRPQRTLAYLQVGMTGPVIRYDPLGRAGRTPLPDSGIGG
jgi:hypothetical protein